MTRKTAAQQTNDFSGGLVTELNPLSYPPNVSFSEVNMVVNRDGSRSRRLGYDLEPNHTVIDTGLPVVGQPTTLGRSQFKWANAGGDPEKSLEVVQVGNHMAVYDLNVTPLSSSQLYSKTLVTTSFENSFSYAVLDGTLVMVNGEKSVCTFSYDADTNTVTESTRTLNIRDLFGVTATVSGVELTTSQEVDTRPLTKNDEHLYNLRNQTFSINRIDGNDEVARDPITIFVDGAKNVGNRYPSNADSVNIALFADAEDSDDRIIERYFPDTGFVNPLGTSPAPRGFFIIDALERGASRLSGSSRFQGGGLNINSLPADTTPGGASFVTEFAGRAWYGGFSGELTDGDNRSPRMSSYILFSQLVNDTSDITECYQQADPTNHSDSSKVATDGGFIKLDSAFGLKGAVQFGQSLLVFAENGVWEISGDDQSGFTALAHSVRRVSSFGCESASSIVEANGNIAYWGRDAIYTLSQDEFGKWGPANITQASIQTLYEAIPLESKQLSVGHFDPVERLIHWVYTEGVVSKELNLTIDQGAFSPMDVPTVANDFPKLLSVSDGEQLTINSEQLAVTVGGVAVTVSGVTVTISGDNRVTTPRQIYYVAQLFDETTIKYTFALRGATDYFDWNSLTANLDSPAHLLTGSHTGGSAREEKGANYLTLFMERAADGTSGCLFSSQWDWANNVDSGRWSTPRQAYRAPAVRHWPPGGVDSGGHTMAISRNKVRGSGRSVAFKFESEVGKSMRIYGWAYDLQAEAKD